MTYYTSIWKKNYKKIKLELQVSTFNMHAPWPWWPWCWFWLIFNQLYLLAYWPKQKKILLKSWFQLSETRNSFPFPFLWTWWVSHQTQYGRSGHIHVLYQKKSPPSDFLPAKSHPSFLPIIFKQPSKSVDTFTWWSQFFLFVAKSWWSQFTPTKSYYTKTRLIISLFRGWLYLIDSDFNKILFFQYDRTNC